MRRFSESDYAMLLADARVQFDMKYLDVFRAFASIAHLEVPDAERPFFGTLEHPDKHPEDFRSPSTRFLFNYGIDIPEVAFRFGTRLANRNLDGSWNYQKIRRRVTAEILPLRGVFKIAAFVFEDQSLGEPDRHARVQGVVPMLLNEEERHIEPTLALLWGWALDLRREDLLPEHRRGEWEEDVLIIPGKKD